MDAIKHSESQVQGHSQGGQFSQAVSYQHAL